MDTKNCEHCGAEIPPKRRNGGWPKRFCSPPCKAAAQRARKPSPSYVARAATRAAARQGLTCEHCGRSFDATRYGTQKFCSRKCWNQADYAANGDKIRATSAARYWADPEGQAAWHAAHYQKIVADPDKLAKRQALVRQNKYGITPEQHTLAVAHQRNLCAICGSPSTTIEKKTGKPKALAVDHCHTSGKNRELLCSSCNVALGNMNDDPARLRAAADYIERHVELIRLSAFIDFTIPLPTTASPHTTGTRRNRKTPKCPASN
jgi:Recombination endonuclease VII